MSLTLKERYAQGDDDFQQRRGPDMAKIIIEAVRKLEIGPDDIVVITLDSPASQQQHKQIFSMLEAAAGRPVPLMLLNGSEGISRMSFQAMKEQGWEPTKEASAQVEMQFSSRGNDDDDYDEIPF